MVGADSRIIVRFIAFSLLFCCAAFCAAEDSRIGFEEQFDTSDGWSVTHGAPLKSIKAENGTVRFETVCGALDSRMKRPEWPEWPEKPFDSSTDVQKQYGRSIDLDKYHYVVVKLDERGTSVCLSVCGSSTPVAYTTGLRAFDLKTRNIGGTQPLRLTLNFLNTSGVATFDFVRLVSELTPEEQAVLMAPPLEYREEKLTAHPYHGLEALNQRAGRPRNKAAEGQLAIYRDTLSEGEVWKLTDFPGDQTFVAGDEVIGWGEDGRFFSIAGGEGRNVFDHQTGTWLKSATRGDKPIPDYTVTWRSRNNPDVIYGYRTSWNRPACDFVFYRFDAVTGKEEELGRYASDGKWDVRELAHAENSDRVALGLRGTPNVCIFDPDAADAAQRLKPITLKTRLKALSFGKDDATLIWANCYTYEFWERDIATGETHLGYYTGGGHAGSGFGRTLRHYEDVTVIQPNGLSDWKAGDQVKIFANYKHPLPTDYGRLVDGGNQWLVNGSGADVQNQHLLIDGNDTATILRLCGYNTSRNNWSTNTYSIASPDTTKVAWVSDQLGDGDIYFVVARRPDAPGELKVEPDGGNLSLSWKAPRRCRELLGYCIYAAGEDEVWRPLQKQLVTGTSAKIPAPEGKFHFRIAAREHSGLESLPSPAASLNGKALKSVLLYVVEANRSRTARLFLDGRAQGVLCARKHIASPLEKEEPTLSWPLPHLADGEVKVSMRTRSDTPHSNWEWKAVSDAKIDKERISLTIPDGVLIDSVLLTSDTDSTDLQRRGGFAPVSEVTGAAVKIQGADAEITWTPPAEGNYARTEIYCGETGKIDFSNATVLGAVLASQPQKFIDWGQARPVSYALIAVDTQGGRSKPVNINAPFEIKDHPSIVKELADVAAPGFGKVEHNGEAMIAPLASAEDAREKKKVTLEIPIEVPAAGSYSLWARYAPGYAGKMGVDVTLSAKAERWELRAPYRPMSSTLAKPAAGKDRVYADRVCASREELFQLGAGAQKLTLTFDVPASENERHAIAKIYLTTDPSWRPPDYNPRADFDKK